MRVKLPQLLTNNLVKAADLHPVSVSIAMNRQTPHKATMVLHADDASAAMNDWIRLFTEDGEAGIFMVNSRNNDVGNQLKLGLRHGICLLARDKPRIGTEPITGTFSELLAMLWAADGVTQTPSYWAIGDVPQTDALRYTPNGENLLQAMETLLKTAGNCMWQLDQSSFPWVMNVVQISNEPRSEGRFSRNLQGVEINEDNYDLVTRVYIAGRDGYTDADTVNQWGVFAEELTLPDSVTEDSVSAYVADYLEAHKNPTVSIRLNAVNMSRITGEAIDRFALGDMCRACLPDYGITLLERIESMEYPDVYGNPSERLISMSNRVEMTPDLLVYTEREAETSVRNISRRVSYSEKNIAVNAESIQVNAKNITVKADSVDLQAAIVRLNTLEADMINVETVLSGEAQIAMLGISGNLYAENVNFPGNVSLKNKLADWKKLTVYSGGDVSITSDTSRVVYDYNNNPIGKVNGIPSGFTFTPTGKATYDFLINS